MFIQLKKHDRFKLDMITCDFEKKASQIIELMQMRQVIINDVYPLPAPILYPSMFSPQSVLSIILTNKQDEKY